MNNDIQYQSHLFGHNTKLGARHAYYSAKLVLITSFSCNYPACTAAAQELGNLLMFSILHVELLVKYHSEEVWKNTWVHLCSSFSTNVGMVTWSNIILYAYKKNEKMDKKNLVTKNSRHLTHFTPNSVFLACDEFLLPCDIKPIWLQTPSKNGDSSAFHSSE